MILDLRDPMTFVLAAALSAAATHRWRPLAARWGLEDQPNPIVPQHRTPVVHMGGLVVAGVTIAVAGAAHAFPGGAPAERGGAILWLGMGFLALGAADDLVRLRPRAKLIAQVVMAAIAAGAGMAYPFTHDATLDWLLSAAVIVTLVNAVNLTDVCDGLVSGLSVIVLTALAVMDSGTRALTIAAAGAASGFLAFNRPPATVFLGDAGSHWLGFLLAALMLSRPAGGEAPVNRVIGMTLLASVFVFELALLLLARTRQGIPFWQGSPDHFSLRLQQAGLSCGATDAAAWGACTVACTLAVGLQHTDPATHAAVGLSLAAVGLACLAAVMSLPPPPRRRHEAAAAAPRRILWIHQNFVTARQAGNSRPIHLVAAWLERGWAVDVIASQAGYLDRGVESTGSSPRVVIQHEGLLTIHRLRHAGGVYSRGRSWLSFCAHAIVHLGRIPHVDVIYASSPPLPQFLLAAVASVVRRAPIVLEVRDLWPDFLTRLGLLRSGVATVILEWIAALAYRSARHCVVVSPGYADFLERNGVPAAIQTIAVTGGGHINRADAAAAAWRRAERLHEQFVIVYAGSLNEAYAVDRILRAADITAAAAAPITWLVIGDGRCRAQIEDAAARSRCLRLLGAIPKDQLWPILQACDAGLVSLVDDALLKLVVPGKLFDYFAAALPVVCTSDGVPGAIVRAAGAGFVLNDPTPAALAESVMALASGPVAERRGMGTAGRQWMLTHARSAPTARGVADTLDEVGRALSGRSQLLWMARAAGRACNDVVMRRSRRAASAVAAQRSAPYAHACVEAWTRSAAGGSKARAPHDAPLAVPVLLTSNVPGPLEAAAQTGRTGSKLTA